MYGECNNPAVHSHNYTVEVITRGTINSNIGTVMSLSDLKSLLVKTVAQKLHGKNLDYEINFFKTVVSKHHSMNIFFELCPGDDLLAWNAFFLTKISNLSQQPSTMENLAIFIWQTIKHEMDVPELLHEVKLTDHEQNCVVYNGCGSYKQQKFQTILTSDTDWKTKSSIIEWKTMKMSLKHLFAYVPNRARNDSYK